VESGSRLKDRSETSQCVGCLSHAAYGLSGGVQRTEVGSPQGVDSGVCGTIWNNGVTGL
jgi:hypothetical protein